MTVFCLEVLSLWNFPLWTECAAEKLDAQPSFSIKSQLLSILEEENAQGEFHLKSLHSSIVSWSAEFSISLPSTLDSPLFLSRHCLQQEVVTLYFHSAVEIIDCRIQIWQYETVWAWISAPGEFSLWLVCFQLFIATLWAWKSSQDSVHLAVCLVYISPNWLKGCQKSYWKFL